jgi:hypothetical protein
LSYIHPEHHFGANSIVCWVIMQCVLRVTVLLVLYGAHLFTSSTFSPILMHGLHIIWPAQVDKLVRVRRLLDRLGFLNELPERLEGMIHHRHYKEAVQLYNKTISVLTRHSHVLSFQKIKVGEGSCRCSSALSCAERWHVFVVCVVVLNVVLCRVAFRPPITMRGLKRVRDACPACLCVPAGVVSWSTRCTSPRWHICFRICP